MSRAEIKQKLIDKINSTENADLLLEATRLLEIQVNESEEPYILTKELKESVDKSRAEIENGDFLSHNDANKGIDEWLENNLVKESPI